MKHRHPRKTQTILSLLLLSPLFCTSALAAQADFVSHLKSCKAVSSLVSRAECYDNLLEDYDLDTLNKKSGDSQNWKVSVKPSSIAGINNISLTGDANARFTAADGMMNMPSLTVRCIDGKADAYITWGTNLDLPEVTANSTIGQQGVQAENWKVSADGQTTYIDNLSKFLRRAQSGTPYTVKVWPSKGTPYSAEFDIGAVKDKLKDIKSACFPGEKNWQMVSQPSSVQGLRNFAVTGYAEDRFKAADGTVNLPSLTIRCIDGKADAYVIWGTDLGLPIVSANTVFDGQQAVTEQWPASTDGKSTFLSNVAGFFQRSDHASGAFAVTILTKSGNPYPATFDLDGFAEKTKDLRAACHL